MYIVLTLVAAFVVERIRIYLGCGVRPTQKVSRTGDLKGAGDATVTG